MKALYVSITRLLRRFAGFAGLLALLERHKDKRAVLYLRSLFSIYDAEDMLVLDVPWWTFSATDYIGAYLERLHGEAIVFEYGPGASTIWLSKRARKVYYVEHDHGFGTVMEKLVADKSNVEGTTVAPVRRSPGDEITSPSGREGYENDDFSDYVSAIDRAGELFDLIVIDGRARNSCLEKAKDYLKPGGLIVFDNSSRRRYQEVFEDPDIEATRFSGLAPALPYKEETTVITIKT